MPTARGEPSEPLPEASGAEAGGVVDGTGPEVVVSPAMVVVVGLADEPEQAETIDAMTRAKTVIFARKRWGLVIVGRHRRGRMVRGPVLSVTGSLRTDRGNRDLMRIIGVTNGTLYGSGGRFGTHLVCCGARYNDE